MDPPGPALESGYGRILGRSLWAFLRTASRANLGSKLIRFLWHDDENLWWTMWGIVGDDLEEEHPLVGAVGPRLAGASGVS